MVGRRGFSNGGNYGDNDCSVVGGGGDDNGGVRLVVAVVDGGGHLFSKGEKYM